MDTRYRKVARNISLGAAVERELVSDLLSPEDRRPDSIDDRNNIVIVGGELFNKGAQAMTFTVVDRISELFPEKNIVLLSGQDYQRPVNEKSQYTFDILPWGPEVHLNLLESSLDAVNTTVYPKEDIKRIRDIVHDCSLIIDINGYALSSQRGFKPTFKYLTNIILAKKYGIPMYIFPQSIGPFDYSRPEKVLFNPLLKTYLHYPEIICPREDAGVESLKPYTQHNVQKEFDIVIQNSDYNLANIYSSPSDIEKKLIESDAVGIVPNSKVFERTDPDNLYSLYESAIQTLRSKNRPVYVLRHSVEDLDLCKNIKGMFKDDEQVVLIEDELNAIELECVIDQFDFLIASRYHSIIHAFKNQVPVIAIGWAIKYEEILKQFNQERYFFEGRENIRTSEFISEINRMSDQYRHESDIIGARLEPIQQDSLFDRLFNNK